MYRIFDITPDRFNKLPPCDINYKTQVTSSLNKVDTFVKGRLTNVAYTDITTTDLVLTVDVVYNEATGDLNYPLSRVTTRKWFDSFGVNNNILHFDTTVKVKKYNKEQTLLEGQKRRKTIIDRIFMMSISLGYVSEANARIVAVSNLLQSYITNGDTAIISDVTNSTETWLDDPYPMDTSKTLRQIMIAGLTI